MVPTTTVTYSHDCPYRSLCSDNGVKCATCANNPMRSYYKPIEPYIPYYPYWYYPYWEPNIWYTTQSTTESHWQST